MGSSGFIGQYHLQHVVQERDTGKLNKTIFEQARTKRSDRTRSTNVRYRETDFGERLILVSDTAPSVVDTAGSMGYRISQTSMSS